MMEICMHSGINQIKVAANFDASDSVIPGYEPSSEMLTSQSKKNYKKGKSKESRPKYVTRSKDSLDIR